MSELGERLAKARKSLNLTQKELAEHFEVGWRSIQDNEQGNSVPGGAVLKKYAEMGFDLNRLLVGYEETSNRSQPVESLASQDLISIPHVSNFDEAVGRSSAGDTRPLLALDRDVLQKLLVRADIPSADFKVLRTTRVVDDQMEPTFIRDDIVLFSLGLMSLNTSSVAVINGHDSLLVRRIQIMQDGQTRIRSDNPYYLEESVSTKKPMKKLVVGYVIAALEGCKP